MHRILAGLALAAALVDVPAAHAQSADVVHGGCFFHTSNDPAVTGDAHTGVIGDASVTTTGDATPALIGATVTCWIDVNGVAAPGTTHTYDDIDPAAGVQAGVDPLTYTATDVDAVDVCQAVSFADGTSIPATCRAQTPLAFPPCDQTTEDCLVALFANVIDPTVCPVLAPLAGSYPGGVTVGPDGDVDVPDPLGLGLNPVYDCPPYTTAS